MAVYIITHPLHTSYNMLCQSLFIVGLHTFPNEALHEIAVLFFSKKIALRLKFRLASDQRRSMGLNSLE